MTPRHKIYQFWYTTSPRQVKIREGDPEIPVLGGLTAIVAWVRPKSCPS